MNFSPMFSFFYADLAISRKTPLLGYICKVVNLRPFGPISENRLVPSDICFSI